MFGRVIVEQVDFVREVGFDDDEGLFVQNFRFVVEEMVGDSFR